METLKALPDISGRRFGNVSIGYDRIDQIRMEVATLETLAALLAGCDRESLTIQQVQALLADLQTRVQALTAEDMAQFRGLTPQHLLAVAMALLEEQRTF